MCVHGHSTQHNLVQRLKIGFGHEQEQTEMCRSTLRVSYASPRYCLFSSFCSAENSVIIILLGVITGMFIVQRKEQKQRDKSVDGLSKTYDSKYRQAF